jgi:plasmid stabilization system protein ParE
MESLICRLSAAAKADIQAAADFYDQQRAGLGDEFAAVVAQTLDRICEWPNIGSLHSRRTRICKTPRFPYGVVFQNRTDHLMIVAVYHLHRHPDCWQDRVANE